MDIEAKGGAQSADSDLNGAAEGTQDLLVLRKLDLSDGLYNERQ